MDARKKSSVAMHLMRNQEVKFSVLLQVVIVAIAAVISGIWDWRFGLFLCLIGALLIAIQWFTAKRRYHRMAQLAAQIDSILHSDEIIPFHRYEEGEIAILESEIYKMTTRLREQRQKLEDDQVYLADSIADISHQVRTPLTSIHLLVSLLSDPEIQPEKRRALLQELKARLSQIDWLISALLKISKLDAGTIRFQREEISIRALVDKALEPLLVTLDLHDQKLVLDVSGCLNVDLPWTAEAVTNIAKNCMEHMDAGGVLHIEGNENELFTEIVISDTGKGIDPDDLPHIFERFYKGKNADDKSVGIGLALARTIVISQNGTLRAQNRLEGGAQFVMRFYKQII